MPTEPRRVPGLPPEPVTRLAKLAAEHADDADRDRRLNPLVVEAIGAAGFRRHFVPARWGGAVGGFARLLDAVATVGESCVSTAWVAALQAAHGRLAAYLPTPGQSEIWSATADVPIAAAVVPPAGSAVAVPGGWRLSGDWGLASAAADSDWILLASLVPVAEARQYRVFAVPVAEVSIRDTWHNVGMRGTASDDVSLDGVFVPLSRSLVRGDLDSRTGEGRCHRVPVELVAALMFAAPILGGARGGLTAWTSLTRQKRLPDGTSKWDDPMTRQILARSAGELDAAELLLRRAAEHADESDVDARLVARNMRDCCLAVEILVGVVERLFRDAGTRAQAADCALQRYWRDVHAAAGHGTLRFPTAATAYVNAVTS